MSRKRPLRLLAAPVAASLLLAAAPALADDVGSDFVDGIAAQVGTDIVLASEVQQFSRPVEQKMRDAGAPESEIAKMRAEILEQMIERRLMDQAVRRIEIDATEAEIDDAIAAIAAETGLTPEQLQRTVEAKGMTYEAYREKIRQEIQRQKLVGGAIRPKVKVEEEQVRALFDERFSDQPTGGQEVHLRHLLVPNDPDDPGSSDVACAKAEAARGRVEGGENFAEVARELSAVNAPQGGSVGWVHGSALAAWMATPVADLQPGQTSPVIPMPFGCNLLFLEERRDFQPITYEQARPVLHQELFEQNLNEEYDRFLEDLREQTYIERKGIFADAAPILANPVSAGD